MGIFSNLGNSAGGFIGMDTGAKAPGGMFGNAGAAGLNNQASLYDGTQQWQNDVQDQLQRYGQGTSSLADVLGTDKSLMNSGQRAQVANELATGPLTGTKFATEQVQSNPILSQLYGSNGLLPQEIAKEQQLQNQGFKLTPEDHEAYGQASGNIARMFGQQEQSLSQSLANRGLASSGSGAAGIGFTGLQGNKNEQLAKAQMDIANQRMQNTMQRVGQQHSMINSLGGQAQNAINSQFDRQLQGVNAQKGGMSQAAGQQNAANNTQNDYQLGASKFNADHTPVNAADYAAAGAGAKIYNGISGTDPNAPKPKSQT